jgi:4-hydroxy-3-polyprenylbenzoate decarboxylase
MGYDLRNAVDDLKKAGRLVEIDREMDWNYEIPAFEVLSGRLGGPAFLFNKIKGIKEENGRVLVGHLTGTFKRPFLHPAIMMGMDPNVDKFTFFREYIPKLANMLRPVEVATGPCKEVVKMGKDVNLFEYPFTYHAIGDAAKYIMLNQVIVKDPDSDWINSGDYGIEVLSRNRLVLTPQVQTNWVLIYTTKYELRGQSMPIAVALGGDPVVQIAAGTMVPPGVTEYDMAGGLRGTPIELTRCETSDLLVPADAEMVIEGEVRPYERLLEGPKIENFGFSVGPRQPLYAMRVYCITHRNNPIIADIHTGLGCGTCMLQVWNFAPGFYMMQKMMGMPIKLNTIGSPSYHGGMNFYCIYDKPYPGFMHDMFDLALGNPGMALFQLQLWMDGEVDFFDVGELEEAMHTQTNPLRDWMKTEPRYGTSYMSCSWQEDEDREKYFRSSTLATPRMMVDATTKEEPPQGVKTTCFETLYPDELQKWVVENWQRLGFKEEAAWKKAWREAKL